MNAYKVKRIYFGIVALILMFALAGCGTTSSGTSATATKAAVKYPTKSVTVVVGFGPGGGVDTAVRGILPFAQKYLGANIVVDNKPGSNGLTAANYVGQAKPDGYTLLALSNGMTLSSVLYPSTYLLKGQMQDAMIPLYCWVTNDGNGLFVSTKSNIQTIDQLAALAHQRSVKIAIAGGLGSTDQITALELQKVYGGNWVVVPMNSAPEALAAVEGGQVDCGTGSPASTGMDPSVIRMLAVTNADRSTRWPDVKTFTELGKPDLKVVFTVGVVAPAGTPPEVVKKIEDAFDKARNDPNFIAWATKTNQPLGAKGLSGAEYKKNLDDYTAQMSKLVPDMQASVKAAQGSK